MAMKLAAKKILVTGGAGFLGSFVVEALRRRAVAPENIFTPRSHEYDLRKRENCERVVAEQNVVIHLAANVGGIGYNRENPGTLLYDNLIMGVEMMEAARKAGVEKFVTVSTVCAYPKFTPVPFREQDLWVGYPEETNAPYGLAKKILLVQAQAYRQQYGLNAITLFLVNLYGPRDNFDLKNSHVIPALIRKMKEAKNNNRDIVDVWGTGKATREFLYVEDAAEGIVRALEYYDKPEPVNIGSGIEISISDLVKTIAHLCDFKGTIRWDASQPDGQPRRLLDISRAKKEFGLEVKTNLEEGLAKTILWYAQTASSRLF